MMMYCSRAIAINYNAGSSTRPRQTAASESVTVTASRRSVTRISESAPPGHRYPSPLPPEALASRVGILSLGVADILLYSPEFLSLDLKSALAQVPLPAPVTGAPLASPREGLRLPAGLSLRSVGSKARAPSGSAPQLYREAVSRGSAPVGAQRAGALHACLVWLRDMQRRS